MSYLISPMFDAVMIVLSSISLTLLFNPITVLHHGEKIIQQFAILSCSRVLNPPLYSHEVGVFWKENMQRMKLMLVALCSIKVWNFNFSVAGFKLGMNTAAYGLEDFGEVDFFVCLIHIHISLAVPHQSFWLVYELLVQLHIMLCYIKLAISFPRLFDRFGQPN